MVTRRPRALSRDPRLEAVRPLPSEEATPPVTNRCLVAKRAEAGVRSTEVHANTDGCRASRSRHAARRRSSIGAATRRRPSGRRAASEPASRATTVARTSSSVSRPLACIWRMQPGPGVGRRARTAPPRRRPRSRTAGRAATTARSVARRRQHLDAGRGAAAGRASRRPRPAGRARTPPARRRLRRRRDVHGLRGGRWPDSRRGREQRVGALLRTVVPDLALARAGQRQHGRDLPEGGVGVVDRRDARRLAGRGRARAPTRPPPVGRVRVTGDDDVAAGAGQRRHQRQLGLAGVVLGRHAAVPEHDHGRRRRDRAAVEGDHVQRGEPAEHLGQVGGWPLPSRT